MIAGMFSLENVQELSYPCGICQFKHYRYCAVKCANCHQWYHKNCERLLTSDISYMEESSVPYVCSQCCDNENGEFSFDMALARIEQAFESGNIEDQVQMEKIFMRFLQRRMKSGSAVRFSEGMIKDTVATYLLGHSEYLPVVVRCNGNSLFNALSMAIQGNEYLASEIRVRTFIEMFQYKEFYLSQHLGSRTFSSVCASYSKALRNCGHNFAFSCEWTIHAAASVCTRSIMSVYPKVNGPQNQSGSISNREFKPRVLKKTRKNPVYILWSSIENKTEGSRGTNHCVPLLLAPSPVVDDPFTDISCMTPGMITDHDHCYATTEKQTAGTDTIQTTSSLVFDSFSKDNAELGTPAIISEYDQCYLNSEMPTVNAETHQVDYLCHNIGSFPSPELTSGIENQDPDSLDKQNFDSPVYPMSDSSLFPRKCTGLEESYSVAVAISQPQLQASSHNSDTYTPGCMDHINNFFPVHPLAYGCLHNSFLGVNSLVNVLKNCTFLSAHPSIPKGIKNDVYFVVQNLMNVQTDVHNMKNAFSDDCGVWESPKGQPKTYFIKSETGESESVCLRKNQFQYPVKRRGIVKYETLESQSVSSMVVKICCYYVSLRADSTYKKRVSWLENQSFKNIFVVEYLGKYPSLIA